MLKQSVPLDKHYRMEVSKCLEYGMPLWFHMLLSFKQLRSMEKSKKITSRSSNDPDPSGMKVWFTPPGKETPLAEVLAAAEEVWSGY